MKPTLYFTFGNHMHWVDMEWLWGYGVLPGSVRDMLDLIESTGARGNVNFDGVGYERMAAECPEALAALRDAVRAGLVEPVGCSYGQPYGLFHGGESNVRQLTMGVRTVLRLLGRRPSAFWEEEFYFFPQLPQVLVQCGYSCACLFFQWTWHTPEIPTERDTLIRWEGADGTRIDALPRTELNVHQWPEDFDGLLDRAASACSADPSRTAAVVQWLELMPSRDWMCRSELIAPRLNDLIRDGRFDVRPRTLTGVVEELRAARPDPPVRRYSMDQVWHGMTAGKNADRHPRASHAVERLILAAEALAATASLLGRPYPGWDVYPTWEIDEAWRELLAAQHHDNYECEGLCGFVGHHQMERAAAAAMEVLRRTVSQLNDRAGAPVVINPLDQPAAMPESADQETVPPFGFVTACAGALAPATSVRRDGRRWTLVSGGAAATVDVHRGLIERIATDAPGGDAIAGPIPLVPRGAGSPGHPDAYEAHVEDATGAVVVRSAAGTWARVSADATTGGFVLELGDLCRLPRPDPGFAGALRLPFDCAFPVASIIADTPFAADVVHGRMHARRKYPSGDWMTSPQWFEDVQRPIHASTFVDLIDRSGAGLLIAHTGGQQFLRTDSGVEAIVTAYDPWDEARYSARTDVPIAFLLLPHGPLTNAQRSRTARAFRVRWDPRLVEFVRPGGQAASLSGLAVGGGGATSPASVPARFGPLDLSGTPGVVVEAFYRESARSGQGLPDWAGHRMSEQSGGACDHPFVIRLVEWDGVGGEVSLALAGPVASAALTNPLGEVGPWAAACAPDDAPPHLRRTGWLEIEHPAPPPAWSKRDTLSVQGRPLTWSRIRLSVRPRQIVTVYADLVLGRKQWRDLDARREVWATVHRAGAATPP